MKDLFGENIPLASAPQKNIVTKTNPMIDQHGAAKGMKCGACKHHFFRLYTGKGAKCNKRAYGSDQSDHSPKYDACGLFEYSIHN